MSVTEICWSWGGKKDEGVWRVLIYNFTHCSSVVKSQARNSSFMTIFQYWNSLTILCVPNTDVWILSNLSCCNQLLLWMQCKASTNIWHYFSMSWSEILFQNFISKQNLHQYTLIMFQLKNISSRLIQLDNFLHDLILMHNSY